MKIEISIRVRGEPQIVRIKKPGLKIELSPSAARDLMKRMDAFGTEIKAGGLQVRDELHRILDNLDAV